MPQCRHDSIILPLPLKAPEFNPVENVYQLMRWNWLSNRIFGPYDQIADLCCDAWCHLRDQQWRIMSIGMRDLAYA
jgi:transposase